jgi:hypothetical protein
MGSLYKRTRKMPDGTKRERPTWWIKYYANGRPVRESTGTDKASVAKQMLRAREGDIEHGFAVNPKMDRIMFEDAAADLLKDYTTNRKQSYGDTKRRVDLHLTPFFKGKRLISITPTSVREYINVRQAQKAANGTINRELAALKRMFALAIDAGTLKHKPKIPMLRENNARQGFFERTQSNQCGRIWRHRCRPSWRSPTLRAGGCGVRFCRSSGGKSIGRVVSCAWTPAQRRTWTAEAFPSPVRSRLSSRGSWPCMNG